ncbi:MAG: CoB--CoM heterodisulfide reductase iron-sulfur subunit A family protein [bacterium]|nr:CoB--CoM heterodisulfide reductase iron-sulfur subunit A family protein [bacterium]
MNPNAKPILVIGGGIAGMTAAVEAAEVGYNVILVEKEAYLGGRVVQMNRYFPKMCPPTCGFEINVRRVRQNPRITVHTLAEVQEISGQAGEFKAVINVKPKYLTGKHPIDSSLTEKLTGERPNDFNYGLDKTKGLYIPHDMAYPADHVLDRDALSDADVEILKKSCPDEAIDWDMTEEMIKVNVGAVIIATGWQPYDAVKLDTLGFGQHQNVITNVMMERMATNNGPTGGEIKRPSDGQKAVNVAFVQCAGSRDENHLAYCSAVCCMASLKQVRYLREANEESKATVFYIDIRTIGRLEKFYYDMLDDTNISFVKGKVAAIREDAGNKNLVLDVEDTISRENLHRDFELVVLATGMVPNGVNFKMPFELNKDDYGFLDGLPGTEGVFSAGCSKHPCDVSSSTKDSTAAALKAIQSLNGGE